MTDQWVKLFACQGAVGAAIRELIDPEVIGYEIEDGVAELAFNFDGQTYIATIRPFVPPEPPP